MAFTVHAVGYKLMYSSISCDNFDPLSPNIKHSYSPHLPPYISYGTSFENLFEHQHMSFANHFLHSHDLYV